MTKSKRVFAQGKESDPLVVNNDPWVFTNLLVSLKNLGAEVNCTIRNKKIFEKHSENFSFFLRSRGCEIRSKLLSSGRTQPVLA